ncbi:DUF1653 domain-containing protein [Patescibacteria group bacterium]|nr:DUF1653 domain-containing protein [Patescibacteria group bacterium]
MEKVKPGKYQHYKGQYYQVIGVAHHSETKEELVVYRALYHSEEYGQDALWVRPKDDFLSDVEWQGKKRTHFKYVGK